MNKKETIEERTARASKFGGIPEKLIKNKFNRHDSIIQFSFDELITTIEANEIHYNEESIKKVFTEIMKLKISQATDAVYLNRDNILKVLEK